jgi:hypothetical protein
MMREQMIEDCWNILEYPLSPSSSSMRRRSAGRGKSLRPTSGI